MVPSFGGLANIDPPVKDIKKAYNKKEVLILEKKNPPRIVRGKFKAQPIE
jgi:hypothetical protein